MFPCIHNPETSLLEDLLEASASLYHRNVAVIQRTFVEQYCQTLCDRQAENAFFREADLLPYWRALKAKQDDMIRVQQALRRERDANVHAYVNSRSSYRAAAA